MGFVRFGMFLGVVVWWAGVSLTAAATAESANTTSQALWPDYANYSGITTAGHFVYFTRIPFTYYEYVTNVIELYNNGYVTLGSTYDGTQPPPPAEWPYDPKLLGVYWSKLAPERLQVNSAMYTSYDARRLTNVTYQSLLTNYVKETIAEPDFEPLVIIAVTWENVRPTTTDNEPQTASSHTASGDTSPCGKVQLSLLQKPVTTSWPETNKTYFDRRPVHIRIRGYKSLWKSAEFANQTYYAATYSQGYGERPKIVIPGSVAGPEVILLGTKKPNKDAYTCVEKTQAVVSRLNSSLNALPPCPCYQVQAAGDQQFKISGASRCYQSINLPQQGGSLYQVCCYNMYGHLINYTTEIGVPVSSDPNDRSLQEAYAKCCADGSGLCEWFQELTYLTKCGDYMPEFNKSALPSFITRLDDDMYNRNTSTNIYLSVRNTTGVTYSLMTTFNSSHGVSISGNLFKWDIVSGLNALRKASYPQLLVIYATDTNKMSVSLAPLYKLCLCQQDKQCDTTSLTVWVTRDKYGMNTFFGPDSNQRGNVNIMTCKCKGNGTGRFCERPITACDNCLVQSTSGCNSNPQGYCPTCPLGYQRSGTQCLAISSAQILGGDKAGSGYLLLAVSCTTCYTLWIQNLLISPI